MPLKIVCVNENGCISDDIILLKSGDPIQIPGAGTVLAEKLHCQTCGQTWWQFALKEIK